MTENYVGRCDECIEVLDGEHGYENGGCFKYVAVVNGVALRFARIYATVNIGGYTWCSS